MAAVATETPEIAAKIPHEIIVAIAKPPGQCPTQACTAAYKSLPQPPYKRILLIKRNSGTASKINPSKVDKIACGAIKGEKPPPKSIPKPKLPSENATGRLANNNANIIPRIRTSFIEFLPQE